jgi:hypothetical protein
MNFAKDEGLRILVEDWTYNGSFDHFPILKPKFPVPRQAASFGDNNNLQAATEMSADPFDSAL